MADSTPRSFLNTIAESFRTCSRAAMPYIIVRPDAEPLADLDGNVIYITSMAEARSWCMPGETIADWEEWAARDASPTFDS